MLAPLSRLYGRIAARRLRYARPYTSLIPVICIGNFTAGGTGKTPMTILISDRLRRMGERPAILTRGYGGSMRGPHLVDLEKDLALQTGDEALLLARAAPTIVSRDRAVGARFIERQGDTPTVIVMDDGMQNPSLAKMLRIAVVDARRGIGNGHVIPAGPLRAPLAAQLDIVDAIVINAGPAEPGRVPQSIDALHQFFRQKRFPGPILRGVIVPRTNAETFRGRPVLAFAGIGYPDRFFDTLRLSGIDVVEAIPFKDHHFFDAGDAERLLLRAEALQARLVTTEKDHVRLLSYADQRRELAAKSVPFRIAMTMPEEDIELLDALIKYAIEPEDLSADRLLRHNQR